MSPKETVTVGQLAQLPGVEAAQVWSPHRPLAHLHCRIDPQRPTDRDAADRGGEAFFALRGKHHDGHRFIDAALAQGVALLILSDPQAYAQLTDKLACSSRSAASSPSAASATSSLAGVFLCPEPRGALAELAAAVYRHPSRALSLLGVTGTNGKTSVVSLLGQLCQALGQPCGIAGTLGFHGPAAQPPTSTSTSTSTSALTTPEAPDLQRWLRACVDAGWPLAAMEVSSWALVRQRCAKLSYRSAALTLLGRDHLDLHGSLKAYHQAKAQWFLEGELQSAVLPLSAPGSITLARQLAEKRPQLPLLRIGTTKNADLRLQLSRPPPRAHPLMLEQRGYLIWEGEKAAFTFPLPGALALRSYLLAVGLLLRCEIPLRALAEAAKHCRPIPGRFEPLSLPQLPFQVIIDYAHTPDALANVLRQARHLRPRTLRLLFGCGGNRDVGKRPLMGAIAAALADTIILSSDNPRDEPPEAILAAIHAGIPAAAHRRVQTITSRPAAIQTLLERAQAGDVLILAGKGHETTQEFEQGRRLPHHDAQCVRQWAETMGR